MDKKYINKKISNIENLLLDCTEDQRPIYQGYLEFWQEKIPKSNEKPDAETDGEESNLPTETLDAEEEPESPKELEKEEAEIIEEAVPEVNEEIMVEEDPEPQWTLEQEVHYAEEFETTYPNKHAYLRRNGELLRTKAFKEFLKSK